MSLIRVLLVEDNPADARLVREYLGEPSESLFHVEWVQDLNTAISRVIEIQPDVVLLDADLPDSHGLETYRQLHLRAPDAPIVVLSGSIDDATALQAVREGAQDYVVKGQPDPTSLARTLRYAVERHDLLRRAQEAELRARGLFEGAADAILVYDVDGRCLDANPAAVNLLGCSAEAIRARDVRSFFTEATLSDDWMFTHLGRGGEWSGELEVLRRDGSTVPVEAKVRSVTISRTLAYEAVLRDVTSRREQERTRQHFVAVATHELRNPLAAMLGWAQLLGREPALMNRAREVIISQAHRLDRLISELLDAARLEAGMLTLNPVRTDLVPLVEAAGESARVLSPMHQVRLELPESAIEGYWDRGRLEQVLQNLLANAIKYSSDGGDIVLRAERHGPYVQVSITDQGAGIPPEALPHLFDRYYRVQATAQRIEGLGLGLWVSRMLIEAHGGELWAESEGVGRGSTFTFALPITPSYGPSDSWPKS